MLGRRALALPTALALALVAACSSEDRTPGPTDTGVAPDSGIAPDSGLAPDAEGGADADVTADAGPGTDATAPDGGNGRPVVVVFGASTQFALVGDLVTLVWNVQNADTVSVEANPGGPVITATTAIHGSATSQPLEVTTTFTLSAVNGAGTTQRALVVGVDPGQPTIGTFVATPNPTTLGGTTVLSWTTTNASRVRVLQGATVLHETTNASEVAFWSWTTGPLNESQNALTLEAWNFAHQLTQLLIVAAN